MASSDIAPSTFGGVSSTKDSLAGLTFHSSCPPIVQRNTRIIGLCGISDHRPRNRNELDSDSDDEEAESSKTGAVQKVLSKGKDILAAVNPSKLKRQQRKEQKLLKARPRGLASPKEDGWFLSDFYLFHHLFQGLGAAQRWYTCESPRTLVSRYGHYAHGEPAGDHRIVLDANMLDALEAGGDIHVRSPESLLQDFLDYLKAECKEAVEKQQPLLLMIFGHGDKNTHGITIGYNGPANPAPRFKFVHLEKYIRKLDIDVTLLTTACYSGGWLLQPQLNVSGLTAASAKNVSHTWDASLGQSYHGSVWTTAVMETLIKMEDPKATQFQSNTPAVGIDELDEDVKSTTFAKLSEAIRHTLTTQVDARDIHQISFAAQDDEWAQEWRQRSGIPLGTFQAQWNKLPLKPAQDITSQRPSKTGGTQTQQAPLAAGARPARPDHEFRKTMTNRQARSVLAEKCHEYLTSFPGQPNSAPTIRPFNSATSFLEEGHASTMTTAELQALLEYRLNGMKLATTLKTVALPGDRDFPACHLFDYDAWSHGLTYGSERSIKYRTIYSKVFDSEVCPDPTFRQGSYYSKPVEYLSAAFLDNDLDDKAVDTAIAAMQTYKQAMVTTITQRIRYDRSVRKTAGAAFQSLGKRLRSPSPQKRGAIPRFSSEISSH